MHISLKWVGICWHQQ